MTTTKFKPVAFSLHPAMIERIKEIVESEMLPSASELVRRLINEYYEGEFRKKTYGYFSGIKTSKARDAKHAFLAAIPDFQNDDPQASIKFLLDVGYITPEEDKEAERYLEKNASGMMVYAMRYRNGSGKAELMFANALQGDVARFMKAKEKQQP